MKIIKKIVSNKDTGRFGFKPEAIVIHIAEGYLNGAYSWFNTKSSRASAHYMIGRNGEIWQFVDDEDTAWHVGVILNPSWELLKPKINPNFYTIGIEHEGFSGEQWSNQMINSSAQLIAQLCKKHSISCDTTHIIGHNKINSVNRSNCPGTGIDINILVTKANNILKEEIMIKELTIENQNLKKEILKLQDELKTLNSEIQHLQYNTDTSLKKENLRLRNEVVKLQRQLEKSTTSSKDIINRIISLFKR